MNSAPPPSFIADVARAQAEHAPGDLALFAEEIEGVAWKESGLLAIERAQSGLRLKETAGNPPHVLLFTGHRVDDPDRKEPRFPADKVDVARQEIGTAIDRAVLRHGKELFGIAGAASGGDIVFQQECAARGIPSKVFLALPKDPYAGKSVNSAGREWTRQFYDLLEELPFRVLQESEALPEWLAHRKDYTVWQRCNLWMLHNALVHGSQNVTLLALWNGQTGDGPGGTADMVDQIQSRGGEVVRIGLGTVFPEG
jgi:hypothetical protein